MIEINVPNSTIIYNKNTNINKNDEGGRVLGVGIEMLTCYICGPVNERTHGSRKPPAKLSWKNPVEIAPNVRNYLVGWVSRLSRGKDSRISHGEKSLTAPTHLLCKMQNGPLLLSKETGTRFKWNTISRVLIDTYTMKQCNTYKSGLRMCAHVKDPISICRKKQKCRPHSLA